MIMYFINLSLYLRRLLFMDLVHGSQNGDDEMNKTGTSVFINHISVKQGKNKPHHYQPRSSLYFIEAIISLDKSYFSHSESQKYQSNCRHVNNPLINTEIPFLFISSEFIYISKYNLTIFSNIPDIFRNESLKT